MNLTEGLFRFEVAVWGYAQSGDNESAAIAAECRDGEFPFRVPLWDRDADEMRRTVRIVDHEGKEQLPPLHWSLPWVTEHRRRAEMAS